MEYGEQNRTTLGQNGDRIERYALNLYGLGVLT